MWNTQRILRASAGLMRSTCCGTVVDHVEQLWNVECGRNGKSASNDADLVPSTYCGSCGMELWKD